MKKILLLCALATFFIGCAPKSELEKHPSAFVGEWRCQTTMMAAGLLGNQAPAANDIVIAFNEKGEGAMEWRINNQQTDSAKGQWVKAGDYLFIDRDNGGFATFQVVSKSDTKMTLVTRNGQILEFTKIM